MIRRLILSALSVAGMASCGIYENLRRNEEGLTKAQRNEKQRHTEHAKSGFDVTAGELVVKQFGLSALSMSSSTSNSRSSSAYSSSQSSSTSTSTSSSSQSGSASFSGSSASGSLSVGFSFSITNSAMQAHLATTGNICKPAHWVSGKITFPTNIPLQIPKILPHNIGLLKATNLKLSFESIKPTSKVTPKFLPQLAPSKNFHCEFSRKQPEVGKQPNVWELKSCTEGMKATANILVNDIAFSLGKGFPEKLSELNFGSVKAKLGCLNLPADPGEEGTKTLAGIDTNSNGVRDDVEIWITNEIPSSQKLRTALLQDAKHMQTLLLSTADANKSVDASIKMLDSLSCAQALTETRDDVYAWQLGAEARLLNTYERIQTNLISNKNFHGQMYRMPNGIEEKRKMCEFNFESMEN